MLCIVQLCPGVLLSKLLTLDISSSIPGDPVFTSGKQKVVSKRKQTFWHV